jgi:hypothetical protein
VREERKGFERAYGQAYVVVPVWGESGGFGFAGSPCENDLLWSN